MVTRRTKQSKTNLAARVTPKILNFYATYFDLPFSLPKLDLITPPKNSFNAMENWGLITFRCGSQSEGIGHCCIP